MMLPDSPAPSASGARLVGDDLQHLIGWYWALQTLRPELGIQSVTLESLGAGNLDDIVIRRAGSEPFEFWQVKAVVSAETSLSTAWLLEPTRGDGPSILQRFWASFEKVRKDHGDVSLVLATNRSIDPNDPVLAHRDYNTLLAPRLRREAATSPGGIGRQKWADHLKISVPELMEMLDVLQFRTDITELSYRQHALDVSIGLGLRIDEAAMLTGIGAARQWVKASRIERTRMDVEQTISSLNLRAAPIAGVLLLQALCRSVDIEPTASIDWVDRFVGDTPKTRRGLRNETDWNEVLLPDLRRVVERIKTRYQRVSVQGDARLPVWFAAGSELADVAGFTVMSAKKGEIWASDALVTPDGPAAIVTDYRETGNGSELAISVAVSYDVTPDVLSYVADRPNIGRHYAISLAPGPNMRAIRSPGEAVGAAIGIRDAIRTLARDQDAERLHLFLAAPDSLVLLLGHFWNHLPPTQLYEDMADGRYQPAFLITS